ncbi:hypothetical protein BR93DRAFT_932218 [Coniochaeta sp. PMI_546]|nr:hypothetical protein BR93DRAFT_932218 [Coniochaeta sp. PMI_546]
MYGPHRSRDREFWGTVVIGADDPGAEVDVVCGTMKCWLKVERQFVPNPSHGKVCLGPVQV